MVGILGVCQYAPLFLLSLFAGVIADRYSKRKILILTQTVFFLQAVTMTVLTLSGQIQYWHILLLSFLLGLMQTLDTPARQSFFIEMVGENDLTNAISLNSTMFNLARIAGPALSGFVILQFGMTFCFFINALTFIPLIITLIRIRTEQLTPGSRNIHILSEVMDGIRYIRKSETLIINVLVTAAVCTFAMNLDVIIPVFAKTILSGGTNEYTLLLSMAGIGSFLAALIMAYLSKYGLKKNFLIISGMIAGLCQILAFFSRQFTTSAILIILIGFSNMIFLNTANSIFQLHSTNEYRGRVMGIYSFLCLGSTPIGNFFAGAVMEQIGGNSGFIACGTVTFLLLTIIILHKRRQIRSWFCGNE